MAESHLTGEHEGAAPAEAPSPTVPLENIEELERILTEQVTMEAAGGTNPAPPSPGLDQIRAALVYVRATWRAQQEQLQQQEQERAHQAAKEDPIASVKPKPGQVELKPVHSYSILKPYTGKKYDGGAAGYHDWKETMEGTLGPMFLDTCLEEQDYYGYDAAKQMVVSERHVPQELICKGLDMQSVVCKWLATTLTGVAHELYGSMKSECELWVAHPREHDGTGPPEHCVGRKVPSAYSLHQAIKEHANPERSQVQLQEELNEFNAATFPARPDHENVKAWLEAEKKKRNSLARRGMKVWLNEMAFVSHIQNQMRAPNGPMGLEETRQIDLLAQRLTPHGAAITLEGIEEALKSFYPKARKGARKGMMSLQQKPEPAVCKISDCGRTHVHANTRDCWRHKDHAAHCTSATCPHHRINKKADPKKEKKKLENKERRAGNRALAALAKSQGYTAEQARLMATNGGTPAAQAAPAASPAAPPAAPAAPPRPHTIHLQTNQGSITYEQLPNGQLAPLNSNAVSALPCVGAPRVLPGVYQQLSMRAPPELLQAMVNTPVPNLKSAGLPKDGGVEIMSHQIDFATVDQLQQELESGDPVIAHQASLKVQACHQAMTQGEVVTIDPSHDLEKQYAVDAVPALNQGADPLEHAHSGNTVLLVSAADLPEGWDQVKVQIDGGANVNGTTLLSHMHDVTTVNPFPIGTANGSMTVEAMGKIYLMVGDTQEVFDCVYIPQLADCGIEVLLCEQRAFEKHIEVRRSRDGPNMIALQDGTQVPAETDHTGSLIFFTGGMLKADAVKPLRLLQAITKAGIHDVLGHPGAEVLNKTIPIVHGVPDPEKMIAQTLPDCNTCHEAKDKRQPIERDPDVPPKEYALCEAVGVDCSAKQEPSIQGAQYVHLIVEFVSKYTVAQLLATEDQIAAAFKEFCSTHFLPEIVQSDGGASYESAEFTDWCTALKITQQRSAPYTQAQNYVAEIGMKVVFVAARAHLLGSGLPLEFWADAVKYAVESINCRWRSDVKSGLTPYETYHGRRPDVSMMRKFGTPAHVMIHAPDHKQLSSRVEHGVFVGLAQGYKAWRIFLPHRRAYVISRHVTFGGDPEPMASPDIKAIEDWDLGVQVDVRAEVHGSGKSKKVPATLDDPEHTEVVSPIPTVKEAVDISRRPANTGKAGKFDAYESYRRQRLHDFDMAKYQPDISDIPAFAKGKNVSHASRVQQARQKQISAEWAQLKKGKQPPHCGGPEPPSEWPLRQAPDATPTHDEGGVEAPSKEDLNQVSPEVEPEAEPEAEAEVEATSVPATSHRYSLRKRTISALRLLVCMTVAVGLGVFTEESWAMMHAIVHEPNTMREALAGDDKENWERAVFEELAALKEKGVYEVIKRSQVPKGKKILTSKFVLKYKEYEQRYKARLVAHGFQQSDEDAGNTFSPVAKFTTFRILMAIACALDLEISSSDVKTAFLNAHLSEPLYMYPPKGIGEAPDTVWKLSKNLYGLKGAPRGWNLHLHAFLLELGFVQSIMDPCLYFIKGLWVLVWVDDTLKVGSRAAINWFEEQCNQRFQMTHTENTDMFVGIEITRDRKEKTLELTQTAYITKILSKFGMEPEHRHDGRATPMDSHYKVSKADSCNGNPELKKEYEGLGFDYPSAAASVLYASICTRPDIAFACKEVCKVMADPGPKHVPVVKSILKYLRGTRTWGLKYTAPSEIMDTFTAEALTLNAHCDASYGDDPDTRRSTQAFVAKLCGGAVGWFSQGQKSTALSTAEAELIALADAIKEVLYMRQAMEFLHVPQLGPTIIYEDNQAVVSTAHNPGQNHGKLKHVAIRTHRVQEEVRLETVDVIFKPTGEMEADALTKALGKRQFNRLALAILGYESLI